MEVDWDDVLPCPRARFPGPTPLALVPPLPDAHVRPSSSKRTETLQRKRQGKRLQLRGLTVERARNLLKAFNMREAKALRRADKADEATGDAIQGVIASLRKAGIRLPSSVACRIRSGGRNKGYSLRMRGEI